MAEKIFCRKNKSAGIHTATIGDEVIKIADRELYTTSNPKIIEALANDPSVEEYETENSPEADTAAAAVRIRRRK
ncbi:hypothetical protein KJ934_00270 [Patescibacteria group bacterium]|nr:hypothetical protein [Patescibacteria group bacterium]MBU4353373.1 hypothetical protein [Patescibacteria group bacterium]MBU4477450.1 hypothetical protein [Patescibacteria group bacterium]MCG2699119.1 hypothetical protein [Candidatus Parcubacteria bacterium]